jgi:cephalosporin hydroxylase
MGYMEDSLEMPLKDLLRIMQDVITSKTQYFGIPTQKIPTDLWVYQEIIYKIKPDVLIEIGNFAGGSTLALAHILDNLNHGRIIAIDIDQSKIPVIVKEHPRITLIAGDACGSFEKVRGLIASKEKVLIIEDSSHEYENTLNVLRKYNTLVNTGSYFIVEDGICHHGLDVGPNPGPYEAVEQFVKENDAFEIDRSKEMFFITWNPKGFLKRIK